MLPTLFFGWVYSLSVGDAPLFPHVGTAFFIAALILLVAALLGRAVAMRGARQAPAT